MAAWLTTFSERLFHNLIVEGKKEKKVSVNPGIWCSKMLRVTPGGCGHWS